MKKCRNFANAKCFQKWKTVWRFAELLVQFCAISLRFPKSNELFIFRDIFSVILPIRLIPWTALTSKTVMTNMTDNNGDWALGSGLPHLHDQIPGKLLSDVLLLNKHRMCLRLYKNFKKRGRNHVLVLGTCQGSKPSRLRNQKQCSRGPTAHW